MSEAIVERRLSTILAADVVGYSRLVGRDEAGTVAAIKAHIGELIEPKALQYRGRIVKLMGDGLLMEFVSVVDAVLFAVEMQGGMALRNDRLAEDDRIVFRIGINIGDIIVDGDDIHGDGVNIAARLESMAEPGGVYLSEAAFAQVQGKLDLNFESLGAQEAKNIAQPISVRRVIMDDKANSRLTDIQRARRARRRPALALLVAGGIVLLALGGGIAWWRLQTPAAETAPDVQAALALPDKPSVVVLPLENQSGDAAQDGLASAISEAITTELARFPELFVISPDSAKVYRDRKKTPREIGRALGVGHVMTGAIQRAGDRLRVTVRLIEAESEAQVWSEKYDRTVDDIFVVQDEIVRAAVTALGETIWQSAATKLAAKPLANFAAYDYWLQGKEVFHKLTPEANQEARRLWTKGVELDPELGFGYLGLAWSHYIEFRAQWVATGPGALEQATAYLERATEKMGEQEGIHRLMAKISEARGEFDKALTHAERALDLNPNDGDLLATYAQMLTAAGRASEARRWIDDAMRRNPHYPGWYASALSYIQYLGKDYAGAVTTLNRIGKLAIWDRRALAASYGQLGRQGEARKQVDAVLGKNPEFSLAKFAPTLKYRRDADREHLLEGLEKAGFPE